MPSGKKQIDQRFLETFVIILMIMIIGEGQLCEINPNCFQGCSDSTCVYDPSSNPFYNSSISPDSTVTYNGPYCCSGCNLGYFLWDDTITCSAVCNVVKGIQTFGNPLTRTCNYICPSPYLGDPSTTKCVTKCPDGYWASFSLVECVTYCPSDFQFHFTLNSTCLKTCPAGNFTYTGVGERSMCGPQCPTGQFGYKVNMSCVGTCPNQLYGDFVSGNCVLNCPNSTYKHPTSKKCETTCFGDYPYGDQASKSCLQVCPFDNSVQKQKYGDNSTSTCVYDCPLGSYAHFDIKICVKECFGNFSQADNTTNKCQVLVQNPSQSTPSSSQSSSSSSPNYLVFILSGSLGGCLLIVVGSVLFYKYYVKKRIVRKPWKYDMITDINFSL